MPDVEVGSLWRRKPPGREVVRVERVWEYLDEGLSVRAHPTTGGRPLVAPVAYLTEHYTCVLPPEAACGVTFSHVWHGYLDDDGRTRVCDGEPRPLPPAE